jgi:hypothetical protein
MGTRYDALSTLSYVIVTGQGWGGQATLCDSYSDDGFKTANNACVSAYGTQYRIKNNGLNPNFSAKNWQATEIQTLSPNHPVGFQMLAASTSQSNLVSSIQIGQSLGSKLFEVHDVDCEDL